MADLHYLTVAEASRALAKRELSAVELAEAHLERAAAAPADYAASRRSKRRAERYGPTTDSR